MCGIFGIWNLDRGAVDLAKLQLATDAIRHRGPDDEGYLLVDTGAGRTQSCGGPDTDYRLSLPDLQQHKSEHFDLAFGFRRLSILDLSPGGHQPMSSSDGRFWIVFNGEIYNYRELRDELAGLGHRFKTTSDTEVILAAYQQWGESCVEHFNGMFALAIWDATARKIFAARDRFGEKPFHYVYIPGRLFAFASEMKAFWAAGVAGRRIHEETLALFTEHGQVEIGEQTIYDGIVRLPQAHCLTLTAGERLQKRRYWDIDPRVRIQGWSDERYAEEFREHFTNSVRLRLRADVPIGSSLSGGLDSSTVVSVISRLLPEGAVQKTFSARFEDPSRDEGKWMDLVTQSNRIERHDVWPTAERFFEELERLFWHQEEPFTSASVYAQWSVMQLAKQHGVTVLLDGQGADEMLAGYHSYFNERTDDLLTSLDLRGYLKWRRDCLALHGVVPGSFRHALSQKTPETVKRLKKRLQRTRSLPQVEPVQLSYPREFERVSNLRKHLWWNTTRQGLVELLRYADRNSMAHSREVRLPFLDHNLVEFVFKVPERLLMRDGWTKWIFREAFRGIVPKEITDRVDKLGYMPPQQQWLGGLSWRDVMLDQLQKSEKSALSMFLPNPASSLCSTTIGSAD
ncbi:MAG TPA: asparagine synthase (glutamine-hydrolyzing) [Pyrinomonadaceae bacterium]|nr:asparagine synthase (glutamine-hydrolyzing) [Pyrinomonadaceae bacterium]